MMTTMGMELKKMRTMWMIGVAMETLAERYAVYSGGGKERKGGCC
jgi:hypothetical protein